MKLRGLSSQDWTNLVKYSRDMISEVDFTHVIAFQNWCFENPDYENDRDYILFEQNHLKTQLEEFILQTPFDNLDFVRPKRKKTVRWDESSS